VPLSASAAEALVPVGQVVGLHIGDSGAVIAGFDEAIGTGAQSAGLQVGDRLTSINGRSIERAADITKILEKTTGHVEVRYIRDGKTKSTRLLPIITDDGPRLGVYLKQGISGVGTITWYDPESGVYGALGHGVNTGDGRLCSIGEGNLYRAAVLSVVKGKSGDPGQLLGALRDKTPIGTIEKNVEQGIFGKAVKGWQGELIPVAENEEIRTGKAKIRSNVNGEEVQEYSVEILKIYPNAKPGGRNMLLRITDPALLEVTGGIVQGMSGSPIIQDGKLIGAVTHVLVNDPTTGYGIFIENMLDAAA
jgi:stage IV sporulation protein B